MENSLPFFTVMPTLTPRLSLLPYLLSDRFCQRVSKPTHISILIVFSAKLQHPACVCKQTQLDIHSTKKMTFNSILFKNTLLCARCERPASCLHRRVDVGEIFWLRCQKAIVFLSYQNTLYDLTHRSISSNKLGNVCVHKIEWNLFFFFFFDFHS